MCPVKREPALIGLSRDHHQALAVALRLKRADPDSAAAAQAAFLEYWREHGQIHFRVEEEVLLPRFAPHGAGASDVVRRVLTDHAEIRFAVLRLEGGPVEPEALRALGEHVTQHVRLEERELFGEIEEALDPAELSRLGADLEAAERAAAGSG
jgi:hypothetical protein